MHPVASLFPVLIGDVDLSTHAFLKLVGSQCRTTRPPLHLPFAQGLDATWPVSAPAAAPRWDRSCCVGRATCPRWGREGGGLLPACPSAGDEKCLLCSFLQVEEDFVTGYCPSTGPAAARRTGRGIDTSAVPPQFLCFLQPAPARLRCSPAAALQRIREKGEQEGKVHRHAPGCCLLPCGHIWGIAEKKTEQLQDFPSLGKNAKHQSRHGDSVWMVSSEKGGCPQPGSAGWSGSDSSTAFAA